MVSISVCLGCGLEVDANGLLSVHLDPAGGITCDDTKGLAAGAGIAGCGIDIDAATRTVSVDTCLRGGISCGATDDDPDDDCLFVNVGSQGGGPCVDLATMQDVNNCKPNGCNGLVRTCDGSLWAPPKKPQATGICGNLGLSPTIDGILQVKPDGDFPASHSGGNEYIVAPSPGQGILSFCFCNTSCVDMLGWTGIHSVTPLVVAFPGQSHRFTIWERLGYPPDCNTTLVGTPWSRQSEVTFDEFGGKTTGFEQALIDLTWVGAPPGTCFRGEAVMTYQRFGPGGTTGGKPNNPLSGSFGASIEYLFILFGYDCSLTGMAGPCQRQAP